ncbi:hypothetical protein B0O80DRAFT_498198 [Mortierella sp. GBAus27b]|nr:hypothetical protein BGX31_004432 [Mortierella sp. GBA43]KAI8355019.1 hypothetical protein B0O80DRAFT_498198 [Mortierella sp. GBAus27b]
MHLRPVLLLATLFALATTVLADLTLTVPNATTFVAAGGSLPIAWTYSGPMPPNPATISVELVDNSKKLFTGPLALFSNLVTPSGGASWTVPKLGFVGNSFSIVLLANVDGQATIFAQGPTFSIQPEGSIAPATAAVSNGQNSSSRARWCWAGKIVIVVATMFLVLM